MKIVVLGGYGNFGARICRGLAGDPDIELVVAGRNIDAARALAREIGAQAAAIDGADPQLAGALRENGAGLVIHTAGPFQGQDYHVAEAAARAGCHYIDLADGRRFVCDFASRLICSRLPTVSASVGPARYRRCRAPWFTMRCRSSRASNPSTSASPPRSVRRAVRPPWGRC